MGEDLILAVASIDAKRNPDWGAADDHIAALKDSDLDGCQYHPALEEELEGAKSFLRGQLGVLQDAWQGSYRDSIVLPIRDANVLITGGSSWGNSPSEAFDAVNVLMETGTLVAAGFDK